MDTRPCSACLFPELQCGVLKAFSHRVVSDWRLEPASGNAVHMLKEEMLSACLPEAS